MQALASFPEFDELHPPETSILSLSARERQTLGELASKFASTDEKRFRMLMEDLAKLCNRATMKDALFTYFLGDADPRRKARQNSRARKDEVRALNFN